MRTGIHPKYYQNTQVVCSCGNTWTTGSTQELIKTDVCYQCHPFFTGEQRIVDTAGQVDRFMKRLGRYNTHQSDTEERKKKVTQKVEQNFLKQQLAALDLNDRVYQILIDNGIMTVGGLVQKVETDKASLMALKGFGAKSLEETESKLATAKTRFMSDNQK